MRTKQEITKSEFIKFRVEKSLKKQYFSYCKKNKIKSSDFLREAIIGIIK